MDAEHEAHLLRIKKQFLIKVDAKYRKGNDEHGGYLPEKSGLIDMALDEIIDLYVYMVTLKEQVETGIPATEVLKMIEEELDGR